MISTGMAIFNFIRVQKENLALEILCLVLAFPFLGAIINPFKVIQNPFTSQEFASNLDTNFLGRGTVTYYRKSGLFLYSPQKSEYGEISGDPSYIDVYKNLIYVDSTFMGPGAYYAVQNSHINLRKKSIDSFTLCRQNHDSTEEFKLTKDLLSYQSKKGDKKQQLTKDEYKKLRSDLENMELVENRSHVSELDLDRYRYSLSVEIRNDNSSYYAEVDGQEIYNAFKKFMDSN